MLKVKNENIQDYLSVFSEYQHNIPVIYSSLEGQYTGELYVNNYEKPDFAILFTPFDFHYVAGNPNTPGAAATIEEVIFKTYIPFYKKEECVLFAPSDQWYPILSSLFEKQGGHSDHRKHFALNHEKFSTFKAEFKIPDELNVSILFEQDCNSTRLYPVARVYKNDVCVSYCSGFMLGKGHAELSVGTEDEYQGKGYATAAALTLITHLLDENIIPDWCAWPFREASQSLAKKLGFDPLPDVTAFIWVKK